jgi:3-oxoadipate enol-lactonase
MPRVGHGIDVSGVSCAWREASPSPDSGTVLLLHGLGGSRLSWEPQLDGLSEQFRVVAWDLPGYGDSPPLPGATTFAALADAVRDLIDELGVEKVHLVGISFGSMIAQYAAAAHPERIASLVLLATSPKFGLDGTRPDEWRAARLAPLDAGREPADFADRVLSALAGPHISEEALAGQRVAMARITGSALRRSIDCLVTHDSGSILGSIVAPTLCMVGDLDTETPTAYAMAVADLIPGARLTIVEDAGHLLNVEAADVVNDAIVEHITSVSDSTSAMSGAPE